MKLLETVPAIDTKSVYMSWHDFPADTAGFRVYVRRRGSPSEPMSGDDDTSTLLGITVNSFFTDMRFFDSSILRRETYYIIKSFDVSGTVTDTLFVNPVASESDLIRKVLNAANYKAQMFFRNPNWAQSIYILRYRKTGQKCTCHSRDFNESRNPDCPICYGGGYVGGFYAPVPTQVLLISQDSTEQTQNTALPDGSDIRNLTLPRFPGVYKGDFLMSDRIGLMSVIRTSFNTIQTSPTPTIMVTAAGLGREHPANKFNFEAVRPRVDRVDIDERRVTVTGSNLVPVVGTVKLMIESGPFEIKGLTLGVTDLKSVTPSAIVFKTETPAYLPQPAFNYRLFLNNQLFKGVMNG